MLGPNAALQSKSDSRGVIRIYTKTQSLSIAKLRFVSRTLGVDHYIKQNAHTQSQMEQMTQADVSNLLPAQYKPDAQHVYAAINTTLSQVTGQKVSSCSYSDSIDVSIAPPIHYRFDVRGGRARFTRLSPGEASALVASYATPVHVESLDSFWEWFGDLVESAVNAVESAFTYVVHTIAEGVRVVIDCVINGVTYIFTGIVKLVEQAFALVESIFAAV